MAMPVPNTTLVKKKKPLDDLEDLASARMGGAAKSETAVEAVAKPTAEAARAGNVPKTQQMPKGPQTATFSAGQADPLDDLAEQRAAAAAELDAGKAKALQDASARAGAGGFGLSGATAALQADIGKVQDRNKVLTMAEFDKRARDEAFADLQRDAVTDDIESAADIDYNDDGLIMGEKVGGKIGDGNPENDPKEKPVDEEDAKRALEEAKAELATVDLYRGDSDTGAGTKQEPYTFENMAELSAWFLETTGMQPVFSSSEYGNQLVIRDQFGNYYTLTNQKDFRERGMAPFKFGDG